jgi:hypothetical protein
MLSYDPEQSPVMDPEILKLGLEHGFKPERHGAGTGRARRVLRRPTPPSRPGLTSHLLVRFLIHLG